MSISMYQASVPPMIRALKNLEAVLQKGAAHAEAKKIDPTVFLTSRLAPDMFTLTRQVQIASDTAKGAASRLAGLEPPKYEDNESSFPELAARIQKTVDYLETFTASQIDGSEGITVTLPSRSGALTFQGLPYLTSFVLPNLYFHTTVAYSILRHNGVEIGKMDYLGKPS